MRIAFCFLLALLLAPLTQAQMLNEIRVDQTGADNDEYFELFGPSNGSLDGLTFLVIGDGTGASGVIEAVVDLTGQTLDASGFFVAAEATFTLGTADLTTDLNFENSDNVTHLLVAGFTGANGDDLDTNDDCSLETTPWTSVEDAVALIEEVNPPTGTECEYATGLGFPTVGPDGDFAPGHVYREGCCAGGGSPWAIGAFDIVGGDDTPGFMNIPVELTAFTATTNGQTVNLAWETASETNNAGFDVQMRQGDVWASLAFVEGHGTTTEAQTYGFTASNLAPGTYAFRLKQVDFDGAFEYSAEVEATVETPGTHVLSQAYPNPFNPRASFTLSVAATQHVEIGLYNALGQRVATLFEGTLENGSARTFSINAGNLPSGIYTYRAVGERFAESGRVTLLK